MPFQAFLHNFWKLHHHQPNVQDGHGAHTDDHNDQEIVTAEDTIAVDLLHDFLASRKSPLINYHRNHIWYCMPMTKPPVVHFCCHNMFVAIAGLMFAMSTHFAASYSSNQKDWGPLWSKCSAINVRLFNGNGNAAKKCRQKWAAPQITQIVIFTDPLNRTKPNM